MTQKQFQALIERLDKIESDIRSCATKIATVRADIYQQMSLLPPLTAEDDVMPHADPSSVTKAETAEAQAFLKRFYELYREHRHGARYMIIPGRHIALIKQLLKVYDSDRLVKLALVMLKTDEEWIEGTDRGIGILHTKASWLEEKLSRWEKVNGPLNV